MTKAKKVLAAALALVMAASAVPMAFAADTETPVDKSAPVTSAPWTGEKDLSNGLNADSDVLGGENGYVSFKMPAQVFTFVQTEPNQHFQFTTEIQAKRNNMFNYGHVYSPNEVPTQGDLATTIGTESDSSWVEPAEEWDNGTWMGYLHTEWNTDSDIAHLKIDFTANGAAVYESAIKMVYDSREVDTAWAEAAQYTAKLPIKVIVLDHQALNLQIAAADKIIAEGSDGYTDFAWQAFLEKYDDAVAATTNYTLTQTEINAVVDALKAAIQNLEDSALNPAITALKEAVAYAQAKLDEGKGWYLDSAVAALNEKIARGEYLVQWATANDMTEVETLTNELYTLADDLENQLKPADFSALEAAIAAAEVYVNDPTFDNSYEEAAVKAVKDAYNYAVKVNGDREGATVRDDQAMIDFAAADLNTKVADLANHKLPDAITKVEIALAGNDSANSFEGNVIYHMTPWYKTWKSQTVELKVVTNNDAAIKKIEWVPANWSVDEPEAVIEGIESDWDDTAVVCPTFGIGPRSFWIQAKVTDARDNVTYSAPVKVRFINYNWQK